MPQRYSHMFRRLTPVWMGDFVIAEVARVAAVADSTDYLTERSQTEFVDGTQETLTIQHRLSGSVDIQRSPGISGAPSRSSPTYVPTWSDRRPKVSAF